MSNEPHHNMANVAPEGGGMPEEKSAGGGVAVFSPRIELGHLIQMAAMIIMIGGWAIVGYQTIEKQLSASEAAMELFRQRMVMDEKSLEELRDTLRQTSADTRQQLSKIIDQVADLRTLVASQQPNGVRR